jgi:hypothetical protein
MPRLPLLRRTTYANVVSTLALVLALGGTSYAAAQLADGQVKTRHLADSAVTSPKIKNGTVSPSDLAAASKQRLWSSVKLFPGGSGNQIVDGYTTFHTLNVPKGKYLVTFAAEFDNLSGQVNGAICDVVSAGVDTPRYVLKTAAGDISSLGGQSLVNRTTAGTISVRCFDTNGTVNGMHRRDSSLTALKIHSNTSFAPTP